MFYFEKLLQTALDGIDSTGIMRGVIQIAGIILIISLVYAVYQAFARGGDVRVLAVAGIEYLVLGLIFLQYGTVFRGIDGAFSSVADFIYSQSGTGDVAKTWLMQLSAYVKSNGFSSFWGFVVGDIVGSLTSALIVIGLVIFPFTYAVFTLIYAMYGSLLYVLGPLVLALLPVKGVGQVARTYAVNIFIFHAWGLIYAVMQVFMSAINLGSMDKFLSSNGLLGGLQGSSQMILLGVISILFAICIAIIPKIASSLIRGEVGSAVASTMSAAYTVARTATVAVVGAVGGGPAGFAAATGGTAAAAQANAGAAPRVMNAANQGAQAAGQQGRAPAGTKGPQSPPPSPYGTPGQYRPFNATHAAGWGTAYVAGWAIGKTMKMIRS